MTYTSRPMFAVPLTSKALKLAKSFQEQYESPAKARQVYLNTLAVYAVDTYCQCLGIETDLEASHSLNPVMQTLMDVADLEITGIGKLECRPVLPTDENCYIPADTWENRLGYVAVEIDESSREATLFGFYPTINPLEMMEHISFDSFQPLEAFLDHLNRLETALDFFQSDEPVAVKVRDRLNEQSLPEIIAEMERIYRTYNKYERRYAAGEFLASYVPEKPGFAFRGGAPVVDREESDDSQQTELQDLAEELLEKLDEIWGGEPVNQPVEVLRQWLEGIFRKDWQPKEAVLTTVLKSGEQSQEVSRVKLIELGSHVVALLVSVGLDSENEFSIHLRLYPAARAIHLPEGLQLTIVDDESGEILSQDQAEETNDSMKIELEKWNQGDRFSVKVAIDDISITESFAI